jgi:membrane fusion protein, multidrug efflux system
MKQLLTILITSLVLASCGNSSKDANAKLNDKKAELEKLKADKTKADAELKKAQDELAKLDTSAANAGKIKLVSVAPVSTQNFQHYIDLQGKIDADNISYISPRMGPSQVKAVYVHAGQYVKKGQLLLKLDDAIMRQNVAAARQGYITAKQSMDGVRTQLSFAKNIYTRQKNLWEQGIGTEVQLLTAKNNVESLEKQLITMEEQAKGVNENVKTATAQLNTANVYSDVSGVADVVNIRVGETFSGMGATGPQIKIVNTSSLKVVVNVPENYISRMHQGSPMQITIPDLGKTINSTVSLISQSIDATQRGFIAEAKVPYDAAIKPNQSAVVKILDYAAANAVVIPINVVQSDETGKYVYVLLKSSNGKTTAHRITVLIGEVYGDLVEIKGGLKVGDQLVTEGFQNLYEGQAITMN